MRRPAPSRRGGAVVEFAFVLLLLLTLIFAGIEFDRMLLVYTSLANATGVGVRYAIVHGSYSAAPSGATGNDKVVTVVKGFAQIGFLNPDNVEVTVEYPASSDPKLDPGNAPGSQVVITVSYPYDPLTFLPFSPTLRATSRGVIVY